MHHPLPPSPNQLAFAAKHCNRVQQNAGSRSSLASCSGADELAIEARWLRKARHDMRMRQYLTDRTPLVPPDAQVLEPPPTAPAVVRRDLLPNGAEGVLSEPTTDRACRHLSAYRTAYKVRMLNECAARRAMPPYNPPSQPRLGAQPVPLYDTERLVRLLEREQQQWAWPKKAAPNAGSARRPATSHGGLHLVDQMSRTATPMTRSRPTSRLSRHAAMTASSSSLHSSTSLPNLHGGP